MKKTIIAMLAFAGGILSFSACQKDLADIENGKASKFALTRTVTVSQEPWAASTKTAFTEEDGIKVTGKETMAVFYYAGDKTTEVSNLAKAVATPDGNGGYTFTHDATAGSTYNYLFLLPNNARVKLNSKSTAHEFWLHPTQFPSEDSFDSNMDALVGQAQYGVDAKTSVSDVKFRRLFSHLELKLSDDESVLGDEKIHAVTFALSTTATDSTALTGFVYPSHSDVYSDGSNKMTTPGNAVTAHYPGGLAKNSDGTYHIWYVVNPIDVAAGTKITVTVTADTKTITREVSLNAAKKIEKGKINVIPFNISGSGYTEQPSAYYNFTLDKLSDLPSEWEAGSTIEIYKDGEGYTNSLRLTARKATSSLTYTVPEGKSVAGIKLYTHPQTPNGNTALVITCGEKVCGTFNLNYAEGLEVATSGGFKYFYDGMSAKYAWPESISTFMFSASTSSTYKNTIRLTDAVVLFEAASSSEGE